MTVSWRSEFNGGDLQTFNVSWWKEFENETLYSNLVLDPGLHSYTDATIPVTADTRYIITVQATNTHGSATSGEHVSCRTSKLFVSHQEPLHYLNSTSPGIIKKRNAEYPRLNKSGCIFRLASNSSIWLFSIIIIILTLTTACLLQ